MGFKFQDNKEFWQQWGQIISSLLLFTTLLLPLGGCQVSPERSEQSNVIKLTLWQGVNPPANRDVLKVLVDRFNQTHPHIQVESLYVGQPDQQLPKILAAVVGNAPPDMLWYNPTITGQLVELNAIAPLDEKLASSPLREQINPSLFEAITLGDRVWAVPFGTNNVGIYYRPSLFKEAGITELPRTWDEFRQVAKKLTRDKDGDGKPDQYGIVLPLGKGEWTVFTWLPFMWSGGGELTTSQTTTKPKNLNVVNQGALAALQFWRDLINDGSAILSLPERGYETDRFIAGKVAMQITGPWTLGALQSTGVDFDVMPIPSQARSATTLGGENLFIFKTNSERENAAFKFAEYVVSEEFQTYWALQTGYLPVNINSSQSAEYQKFTAKLPPVKVFLDQAKNARSRPIFAGYNRVSENLGRAVEAVLLGKNSPQQALEEAQQRLDLIFK